jgi:carboxypeptidase Taq
VSAAPAELAALRERMAELSDLRRIGGLLFWDQQTMMPPRGAEARAEHAATLTRVIHGKETDPALGALLDALEPWAEQSDPDARDVRLIRWTRRDYEKSVRVPAELAADMSRASALGQQAWQEARAADDYARFRDALVRQVELRHRYVECFDGFAHPYDVLLDDFEPGLTTAELKPLLADLRDALVPLVAAAGDPAQARNDGALHGAYPVDLQRTTLLDVLGAVGYDPDAWRLDPTLHPFATGIALGDIRVTTKYDERDLGVALYSVLHEFGHGLYEASVDPALVRTTLDEPVSLGLHESQSRMWENTIGRSRPFCAWILPLLKERLAGPLDGLDAQALYRAVNTVQPSLIRIEADETTYNLHIVLRFELELAMIEGSLAVDDVPAAWDESTHRLLGLEVPRVAEGVLQDVHWSAGLMGYFPTYTLGNLMAAQLWERLAADLPDVEDRLERGEFATVREWLREHVHRHGRTFMPRELLRRVTGDDLRTEPFLRYLRSKLADAEILAAGSSLHP